MNATSNTPNTSSQVDTRNGFYGKHHTEQSKRKIASTQKARYDYLRQLMKQHQQQEQSQPFGPIIDLDSPVFVQKIRNIVRELLEEQIKDTIPTRQNIPLF